MITGGGKIVLEKLKNASRSLGTDCGKAKELTGKKNLHEKPCAGREQNSSQKNTIKGGKRARNSN